MTSLFCFIFSHFFLSQAYPQTGHPVRVAILDSAIDVSDPRLKNLIYHSESQLVNDDRYHGDSWGWNSVDSKPLIFVPRQISESKLASFLAYNNIKRIQHERELHSDEQDLLAHLEKSMPLENYYKFLGYAHGQHVAGIVLNNTLATQIIAVKDLEGDDIEATEAQPITKLPIM